jgi:hypothetical protein
MLMTPFVNSEASDKWFTYLADYDSYPGSIVVNMALKKTAPFKDYPKLIVTGVHYVPKEKGLPKFEDLDYLNTLSEKRLNLIRQKTKVIFAGSFTYKGERLDYIYVKDATGIAALLKEFYKRHAANVETYTNIKDDSAWEAYLDFLYPNKATRQFFKDELKKLGIND